MSRFSATILAVLAIALFYRGFGDAETGTGSLTLAQPAPNVGQEASQFRARSLEQGTFALEKKGIYVLTFWSMLNKGSGQARPQFTDLARSYEDSGVCFAAVYINSAPQDIEDVPYDVIQDSTGHLASLYNVKRVPRLFLIQDGRITLVHNGYYEENEKQLRTALEKVLAEKNSSPA